VNLVKIIQEKGEAFEVKIETRGGSVVDKLLADKNRGD
jgi:hypothetical protein